MKEIMFLECYVRVKSDVFHKLRKKLRKAQEAQENNHSWNCTTIRFSLPALPAIVFTQPPPPKKKGIHALDITVVQYFEGDTLRDCLLQDERDENSGYYLFT